MHVVWSYKIFSYDHYNKQLDNPFEIFLINEIRLDHQLIVTSTHVQSYAQCFSTHFQECTKISTQFNCAPDAFIDIFLPSTTSFLITRMHENQYLKEEIIQSCAWCFYRQFPSKHHFIPYNKKGQKKTHRKNAQKPVLQVRNSSIMCPILF